MSFINDSDVWYGGKRFVVVRGHPDADGDIVLKDPDTDLEQYAKASQCSTQGASVAPPVPSAAVSASIASRDVLTVSTAPSIASVDAQPIIPQGNQTMSQQNTSRRTVSVSLIDQDVNLEGKEAIVLELGAQISEGNTQELIQELIMDPANKVAEALKAHNDKRANVVNREVLNRTGNKVKLEPVKMRDLHWDIR